MPRGSTRRWRTLRAQVLREEPWCRLRLTGCTDISTTVDHVIPVIEAPELEYERSNLQGSCTNCNRLKSDLTLDEAIERWGLADLDDEPDALGFFR